jgi:hypothetical protein
LVRAQFQQSGLIYSPHLGLKLRGSLHLRRVGGTWPKLASDNPFRNRPQFSADYELREKPTAAIFQERISKIQNRPAVHSDV